MRDAPGHPPGGAAATRRRMPVPCAGSPDGGSPWVSRVDSLRLSKPTGSSRPNPSLTTEDTMTAHAKGLWHRTFSALAINPTTQLVVLQQKAPADTASTGPTTPTSPSATNTTGTPLVHLEAGLLSFDRRATSHVENASVGLLVRPLLGSFPAAGPSK